MFVVIVGARERDHAGDRDAVNTLLERLRKKYPSLVVVSAACDRGVGEYVKDRCAKDKENYRFLEVWIKIFAVLAKAKLAQVYITRNATVYELGDEFHIFVAADRRGTVENLVERVKESGRPLYVYSPEQGLDNPVDSPGLQEAKAREATVTAEGEVTQGAEGV